MAEDLNRDTKAMQEGQEAVTFRPWLHPYTLHLLAQAGKLTVREREDGTPYFDERELAELNG